MNLPFSFDPEAAYDLVPLEGDLGLTGRIIAGSLFIARHGTLDKARAWGEIREQTLYLTGTPIVIGQPGCHPDAYPNAGHLQAGPDH